MVTDPLVEHDDSEPIMPIAATITMKLFMNGVKIKANSIFMQNYIISHFNGKFRSFKMIG